MVELDKGKQPLSAAEGEELKRLKRREKQQERLLQVFLSQQEQAKAKELLALERQ